MSAPHITTKEVRRRYPHVIDGGNCRWPTLVAVCRFEKVGYNAGLYGWNYDVFEVDDGVCIVMGYRPPDGNVELDRTRMAAYEDEAGRALVAIDTATRGKLRRALRRKVVNYIRRAVANG